MGMDAQGWEVLVGNSVGITILTLVLRYFMAEFTKAQERIVKMAEEMCEGFKAELKTCQQNKDKLYEHIKVLDHEIVQLRRDKRG